MKMLKRKTNNTQMILGALFLTASVGPPFSATAKADINNVTKEE